MLNSKEATIQGLRQTADYQAQQIAVLTSE